jgi:hypothetical protein
MWISLATCTRSKWWVLRHRRVGGVRSHGVSGLKGQSSGTSLSTFSKKIQYVHIRKLYLCEQTKKSWMVPCFESLSREV